MKNKQKIVEIKRRLEKINPNLQVYEEGSKHDVGFSLPKSLEWEEFFKKLESVGLEILIKKIGE